MSSIDLIEASPLRYAVRVPDVVEKGAGLPMLCFLHGYDEAAHVGLEAGVARHGPLKAGNPIELMERFVIVAPQLPVAGDLWWRYTDAVCEIVTSTARRFECDRSRCYLTGFSFGGNGVFDLSLVQPTMWAALWAVDPTRVPQQSIEHPVWISAGEVARRLTPEFTKSMHLKAPDANTAGPRVWLDDGEDHVGTATRAYADSRIYDWLLQYRRGV